MGAEDMYTLVADEMVARWRAGTVAEYIGERGLLDGYRWELCGGADDYEPKDFNDSLDHSLDID